MSSAPQGDRSAQDGPARLAPAAPARTTGLPSVAVGFVPRPAVLGALASASGRVAVVAAPAGYGKSSHVAVWAGSQPNPVAWVDLNPWSDDPVVVLRSIVEALSWVIDLHLESLPPLKGSAGHLRREVLPVVTERLAAVAQPFVLVIDDLHVLASSYAFEVVEAVATSLPSGSTLVLIGPATPTAMLARLRVWPGVVEVRSDQLALDVEAAARMLAARRPGVALHRDDVEVLVAATEGWPVGVLLAGTATAPVAGADRSSVTTDHAVADFVLSQWLDGLDLDDHRFLLAVSCLEELSGEICDHVAERSGSGAVLRRLYAERSLLTALDRRHDRFRMLQVLRDALRAEAERLDLSDVRHRHRLAADWYLAAGDIEAAVHHAVPAGDRDHTVSIVATAAPLMQSSGRVETVSSWLHALGDATLTDDPRLCLVAATNAFGRHSVRHARAWVDIGLAREADVGDVGSTTWWELMAFGAMVAPDLRVDDARAAIEALPPGRWHALAMLTLGGHLLAAGEVDEACEVLAEALVENQVMGLAAPEVSTRAMLVFALEHRGGVGDWHEHAEAARRLVTRAALSHTPAAALAAAAHTLVADPGDERFAADRELARRSLASVGTDAGWATLPARIALARAALRHGDLSGARGMVDEATAQLAAMPGAVTPQVQLARVHQQLTYAARTPAFSGSSISSAELRVLHHLPSGLTLAEIAERLYVSRNTVKSHSLSIYRKLGVESRRACVEAARESGLLTDAEVMRAVVR